MSVERAFSSSSHLPTFEDIGRSQTLGRAATAPADPDALPRGTTIGRYMILSPLGRGGMGVVYRAYDPDLDRQLAIKLVGLGSLDGDAREHARQRLLREAQALAKLSHPNVVAVHDVGVIDDDVFIAMEYIAGTTLRAWLAATPRSPRDILRVFRAAGAGLAAAHRAGIVHRDFKPDNVMIDGDGRVRVLDFGLARVALAPPVRPSSNTIVPSGEPLAAGLTHAGAVLGTPAYMSPEQDAGVDADPPSDQFSYCVSLYEALYGGIPYRGATYPALAVARASGEVVAPPKLRGVDSRVRRAVLTGLRVAPRERHRDLDALLGELKPRPWTSPWLALAVAAVVVLGGVAGVLLVRASSTDAGASCAAVDGELASMWNPIRRARLTAAFAAVDPRGAEIASQVAAGVDKWTADYAAARTALCEQAVQPGAPLTETHAAEQLQCLQHRSSELEGVLVAFEIATSRAMVEQAPATIAGLHAPDDCAELASAPAQPGDIEAAKPIVHLAFQAQEAQNAGKLDDAAALANQAVAAARASHSPALALALQTLGGVQAAHGDLDLARATFHDAALAAAEIREDGMVADAWIALAQLSFRDRRIDDQLRSALFSAQLAITRLPADDARRATLDYTLGSIHVFEGKLDDAVTELERAIAMYKRLDATKHAAEILVAENSLGLVDLERGAWAPAKEVFDRLADAMRAYGPDNPQLGIALGNQGMLAAYQAHDAEAERLFREALAIYDKLGDSHPLIGEGEFNLGELYATTGRCAAALPHLARARAVLTKLDGADAPVLAMVTLEDSRCLIARDPRRALARLAEARVTAVAHPIALFELPEIDFVTAQAVYRSDRVRARALATSARDQLATIGNGMGRWVREIDRWLAAHQR